MLFRSLLSQVDGDGATAIRKLEAGRGLDKEWMESFSIYIALQITRTPAFRASTSQSYRAMGEEYLRLGFSNVDRARQMMRTYGAGGGEGHEAVTAESLVESVIGGHLRVDVTEAPFLQHMLQQLEFLARWIGAFDWKVLVAPRDTGFIFCDNPFVVVPPHDHPDLVGFGFPGTVKY